MLLLGGALLPILISILGILFLFHYIMGMIEIFLISVEIHESTNVKNYFIFFSGENLAMQRQENEKQDIPVVQKNQASSDVRLEPSSFPSSIIQSFLVVIFGYIQILWTTRPNSSMRTILLNCR